MNNTNTNNSSTAVVAIGITIIILTFMVVLFAATYKNKNTTTNIIFDKPIKSNNTTVVDVNNYKDMMCEGKNLSEILYSKVVQNNDVNKTIVAGIRANCVETKYYKRWNESHRDWDDRGNVYDFSHNKNYRIVVGM